MKMIYKKFTKDDKKYIQVIYEDNKEIIDVELFLEEDNKISEIKKENTINYLQSIANEFKEDLTKDETEKILLYINNRNDMTNKVFREFISSNSNDKVIFIKPIGKINYAVIQNYDRYILLSVELKDKKTVGINLLKKDSIENYVLIDVFKELMKLIYDNKAYIQINDNLFIGAIKRDKYIIISNINCNVDGDNLELTVDNAITVKDTNNKVFNRQIDNDKVTKDEIDILLKCFISRYCLT